jgi:HD-GYP domain-containing protein (c-di-GMP phosphodiesterase class II)
VFVAKNEMPTIDTFDRDKLSTIEAFRSIGDRGDEFEHYLNPHAARIAAIADQLARSFNLGGRDRFSLRVAALAHDLGEVVMAREYIQRPGPLTNEERIDLARHPIIGERETGSAGADRGAQLLVRWHHESWNGSGYPDGLRFEQIPLGARILRVADAYAAMTDARPFRPASSESQAREHLLEWAGLDFDPGVVRALLSLESIRELQSYARAVEPAPEPVNVADEIARRGTSLTVREGSV